MRLPNLIMQTLLYAEQRRIFASVLHDISSPLTVVLMQLEHYVPEPDRAYLKEASTQIRTLIERARSHTTERHGSIDVPAIIANVCALLTPRARVHNVRLVTYTERPLYMYGNQLNVQHILTNLVSNAIEAYDTVANHEQRSVTITAAKHKQTITITVHDYGCGISQATLKRIHKPLFTTKPHGSGFGLTVVSALVKRAGGTVHISSNPTHGTYATVTLPVTKNFRRFARFRRTDRRQRH